MFTWGSPAASHSRMAFRPFSTTFIDGFFKMVGKPAGKFLSRKQNKHLNNIDYRDYDNISYGQLGI